MRKIILLLIVSSILLAHNVSAASLDVSVSPETLALDAGEVAVYDIAIKNNMQAADNFTLSHSGDRLGWMFPSPSRVEIGAGETKTVRISLIPTREPGKFLFSVSASSESDPNTTASGFYYLDVNVPPMVTFENLGISKDGNSLEIGLDIKAREPTDLEVVFELRDSSGNLILSWNESGSFYREDSLPRKTIALGDYAPDTYTVSAAWGNCSLSGGFTIEAVHDITRTERRKSNFLYEEVVIEIYNNGNVVEKNHAVDVHIPYGDFSTGFMSDPESSKTDEEGNVYSFIIPELRPGERKTITYRMDFWPSYTKILASFLIIIIFGVFYKLWLHKPKIKKHYMRKGQHKHHVVIEIKAPGHRTLKNVVLRDWVSPLAHVLHKEFEHARPALRKSDAGTELIWKLGDIAAKEERILSYKIKTLVQGNLKMPRAYIRFTTQKGGTRRIYSNTGIIE